ncbi:MAG: cytochrome c oxidase subunit 3, partial [Verrucomicrobiota bacterium]|nr:cytochrome c oxidase subunit 3 [Verrucomicrobiota bacterium]
MEIPYTVTPRPDTGLANPKLGIWLFLASEVMLFGGLFSGYLFLRLGAEPGYWPHGLLDVRVGAMNTAILIASSVTVVLAWAALKMRRYNLYWWNMLFTIICGALFLIVKLTVEYPAKFHHFGAFIKKDAWAKYEKHLGNEYALARGREPRVEISGHLHGVEVDVAGHHEHWHAPEHFHSPSDMEKKLKAAKKKAQEEGGGPVKILAYEIQPDPINEEPTNPENEKPVFWPKSPNPNAEPIKIDANDVQWATSFAPKHSPYFAIYFTITGLHGLHVFAGVVVFAYFWGPGAKLYKRNPEQHANRIEVSGLFWHFVDLVW